MSYVSELKDFYEILKGMSADAEILGYQKIAKMMSENHDFVNTSDNDLFLRYT